MSPASGPLAPSVPRRSLVPQLSRGSAGAPEVDGASRRRRLSALVNRSFAQPAQVFVILAISTAAESFTLKSHCLMLSACIEPNRRPPASKPNRACPPLSSPSTAESKRRCAPAIAVPAAIPSEPPEAQLDDRGSTIHSRLRRGCDAASQPEGLVRYLTDRISCWAFDHQLSLHREPAHRGSCHGQHDPTLRVDKPIAAGPGRVRAIAQTVANHGRHVTPKLLERANLRDRSGQIRRK